MPLDGREILGRQLWQRNLRPEVEGFDPRNIASSSRVVTSG